MPFDVKGRWFPRTAKPFACRECGRTHDASHWINEDVLLRTQTCNECLGWLRLVAQAHREHSVRSRGIHYLVAPEDDGGQRSLGGRRWRIDFDDGRVVLTSNLWVQGVIPAHFRFRLPDNAVVRDAD